MNYNRHNKFLLRAERVLTIYILIYTNSDDFFFDTLYIIIAV